MKNTVSFEEIGRFGGSKYFLEKSTGWVSIGQSPETARKIYQTPLPKGYSEFMTPELRAAFSKYNLWQTEKEDKK